MAPKHSKPLAPAKRGEKPSGALAPKAASGSDGNKVSNDDLMQMLRQQMEQQREVMDKAAEKSKAKPKKSAKGAGSKDKDDASLSFSGRSRGDKITATKWSKMAVSGLGLPQVTVSSQASTRWI